MSAGQQAEHIVPHNYCNVYPFLLYMRGRGGRRKDKSELWPIPVSSVHCLKPEIISRAATTAATITVILYLVFSVLCPLAHFAQKIVKPREESEGRLLRWDMLDIVDCVRIPPQVLASPPPLPPPLSHRSGGDLRRYFNSWSVNAWISARPHVTLWATLWYLLKNNVRNVPCRLCYSLG